MKCQVHVELDNPTGRDGRSGPGGSPQAQHCKHQRYRQRCRGIILGCVCVLIHLIFTAI